MFDHVTLRVSDRAASQRFYDTVLKVLGRAKGASTEHFAEWDGFSIAPAGAERAPTRRLHLGFYAPSHELVDAFWRAGTEAGFSDDGAPGPRPQYGPDYYGGFLLDPDGNSAEAVYDAPRPHPQQIDHLWIRVADLARARAFYVTIAPHAGLELTHDEPDRVQFSGDSASFSLLPGDAPTADLHMAFGAREDATVQAFHAAATAAGYRDNGAPGERPIYHPGYYAAFVLDPDGNNVEVVNHHRGSDTDG